MSPKNSECPTALLDKIFKITSENPRAYCSGCVHSWVLLDCGLIRKSHAGDCVCNARHALVLPENNAAWFKHIMLAPFRRYTLPQGITN